MKPREPRQKVLVRARIKADAGWHDGCILNVSSRGLLMQAADPPPRGSYLEIRRGALVIVAQVVWTRQHRFGVKSQGILPIDAIVRDLQVPIVGDCIKIGDRRAKARTRLRTADGARHFGRMSEYGFVVALAVACAGFVASEVYGLLSVPMEAVMVELSD